MPACILGSEGLQNIVQKHFSEKHRYLRTYSGKKGLLQKFLRTYSAAAPDCYTQFISFVFIVILLYNSGMKWLI